jgi:hypothetical protein
VAERVYRSMKARRDGFPEVGRSARALGVRPDIDGPVDAAPMGFAAYEQVLSDTREGWRSIDVYGDR